MEFAPVPTATHNVPFHVTPRPMGEMGPVTGVQLMPSVEQAMLFVPVPTATHNVPLNATPLPKFEKMLVPIPVQVAPSSVE